MLQQSTLSISAHQSNQDASFAESDSKDLLQQHDATSSCCPSSSSSCSTTDTFSTGRRSRIGGNDNSVVRAVSPEGRRYLKPVNGIQAKGFARSGKFVLCVLPTPLEDAAHETIKSHLYFKKHNDDHPFLRLARLNVCSTFMPKEISK